MTEGKDQTPDAGTRRSVLPLTAQIHAALAMQNSMTKSIRDLSAISAAIQPPKIPDLSLAIKNAAYISGYQDQIRQMTEALRPPTFRTDELLAHVRVIKEMQQTAAKRIASVATTARAISNFSFPRMPDLTAITAALRPPPSSIAADLGAFRHADLIAQMTAQFAALKAEAESFRAMQHDLTNSFRLAGEVRQRALASISAANLMSDVLKGVYGTLLQIPSLSKTISRFQSLDLAHYKAVVEELAASDQAISEWESTGEFNSAAADLDAELSAHPEFADLDVVDQIRYLVEWSKRHDESPRRMFLIAMICNLVSNLVFWLAVDLIPSLLRSPEEGQKHVVNEVRVIVKQSDLPETVFKDFRIVERQATIQEKRKAKSGIVAVLEPGTIVRQCKKVGKWSLVYWTDSSTGESWQGWVLAKYLSRF